MCRTVPLSCKLGSYAHMPHTSTSTQMVPHYLTRSSRDTDCVIANASSMGFTLLKCSLSLVVCPTRHERVMGPVIETAARASLEHDTLHRRLTVKQSRRVEAGSRRRISDSRAQDDSAGSRSSHGELERTGSRRARGRRTDATRRNATSATAVGAAQLEDKAMRRGDKVAAAGGRRTCTWKGRAATGFEFWKRK